MNVKIFKVKDGEYAWSCGDGCGEFEEYISHITFESWGDAGNNIFYSHAYMGMCIGRGALEAMGISQQWPGLDGPKVSFETCEASVAGDVSWALTMMGEVIARSGGFADERLALSNFLILYTKISIYVANASERVMVKG